MQPSSSELYLWGSPPPMLFSWWSLRRLNRRLICPHDCSCLHRRSFHQWRGIAWLRVKLRTFKAVASLGVADDARNRSGPLRVPRPHRLGDARVATVVGHAR
ncbi:hypothetical protein QYF36_018540 [Acer negundo]|nr:hypothetical protein QYF36_018540 [Acer negundo]